MNNSIGWCHFVARLTEFEPLVYNIDTNHHLLPTRDTCDYKTVLTIQLTVKNISRCRSFLSPDARRRLIKMGSSVRPSVDAVCGCIVSSNRFVPIVLKLSRCFVHGLKCAYGWNIMVIFLN